MESSQVRRRDEKVKRVQVSVVRFEQFHPLVLRRRSSASVAVLLPATNFPHWEVTFTYLGVNVQDGRLSLLLIHCLKGLSSRSVQIAAKFGMFEEGPLFDEGLKIIATDIVVRFTRDLSRSRRSCGVCGKVKGARAQRTFGMSASSTSLANADRIPTTDAESVLSWKFRKELLDQSALTYARGPAHNNGS